MVRLCFWAVLVVAILGLPSLEAEPASLEYQVKAAYLFNFCKYVTWPAENLATNSPIVIGILGDDPFGPTLDDMLATKTLNGHKFKVQREDAPENLHGAHIVFISRSMERRLENALHKLEVKHVLLVSDINRFSRRGGMIGFVFVGPTVRFEIDRDVAERNGLKISAQLLSVATVVYSERNVEKESSAK